MRYLIGIILVILLVNNLNATTIKHHKLSLQGGYWFYSESANRDFNGPYLTLEYEYLFNKYFGLAISNGAGGNFENDYQGKKVDYMKIVSGFLITPKYYFISSKSMLPFVGLGVGSYSNEVKMTKDGVTTSKKSSNIGYQGLIGADFSFSTSFSISLEDRYSFIKVNSDGTENISGNNFYVGLNYHF